jgi:hypothetical protein
MEEMTLEEYMETIDKRPKRSKYGNKKTTVDGHEFDSKAEAARYQELRMLEVTGAISGLRIHPVYELLPTFKDGDGNTHKAIKYEGDFSYINADGELICEDVKGVETDVFKIKRKLLAYYRPDVRLVVVKR